MILEFIIPFFHFFTRGGSHKKLESERQDLCNKEKYHEVMAYAAQDYKNMEYLMEPERR